MLHANDVEDARRTWQEAVQTGKMYDIEYRFKDRQTGGYRWFLGPLLPLRDESGRIIRWFGTCADIHDKKMAQEFLSEPMKSSNSACWSERRNFVTPTRSSSAATVNCRILPRWLPMICRSRSERSRRLAIVWRSSLVRS